MARTGVLIVAAGGPAAIDDIPAFLELAHGCAPSDDEVQTARRMLLAIGGVSPAPAVAERIAAALERSLNGLPPATASTDTTLALMTLAQAAAGRADEPVEVRVLAGSRAGRPSIADALETLAQDGVSRVVCFGLDPLTPPSEASSDRAAVEEAASRFGIDIVSAGDILASKKLVEFLANSYSEAIATVTPDHKPVIVFTAKAVPGADAHDDRYVERVEEAVLRMVQELGLGDADSDSLEALLGVRALGGPGTSAPWLLAYQSAERVENAVSPDLFAVIDGAAVHGFNGVAFLPIGFAMDGFETMSTLDILAAEKALDNDMEFARAVVANDDALVIDAMDAAIGQLL